MLKYTPLLILLSSACHSTLSPPHSPTEELATFELAPGFRIQLVASEPMVQDPIVIQFDQDGRLWVVEMRGFMPDIDGTGEDAPVGRVSILFDHDHDGQMDSSTVFVDSLVLPRALAIVENGVLVAEDEILWFMEDSNGDLIVDARIPIDPHYGKKGVVEHSPNGLWRGMDNWYYNAKSNYRYRQVAGQWIKEETEFRGQWGISHNNYGQLYYNYNWSQLHADLVPPNYLSGNPNHQPTSGIDYSLSMDRRIFPVRSNPAINRGYIEGTLDDNGRLVEFTSACAPYVYRGDLFDSTLVGDVFVCEPTGNLIKRNIVTENAFYPVAENAYNEKEFLASTDERFRPVWLTSGPDGALYVADMYRGIIQHGLYMSPYLREVTLKRKLDQHINLGRIWRIVPDTVSRLKQPPSLSTAAIDELLDLLGHSNGWIRDMVQRLLVEKKDPASLQGLKQTVINSPKPLARLHAIWTLEGLGYNDPDFFQRVLLDENLYVQTAALRILEHLAEGNPVVMEQFEKAIPEPDNELLALQLALSARVMTSAVKLRLLSTILSKHLDSQVFRDAVISSIADQEYQFLNFILVQPSWQSYSSYKEITIELLATAVANKGDPEELTTLLNLIDVKNPDWEHEAIITGLSFHNAPDSSERIPLKEAPGLLSRAPKSKELNSKISRISALYTWPGQVIKTNDQSSETVEPASPEFLARGRNIYLAVCANCHGNDGKGLPRFAPPLLGSEWVLGTPERLIRILLHGMEGPVEVNGRMYRATDILPVMPAFASTPVEDLAAVMTYIRQAWGHQSSTIEPGTVGKMRVTTQGKVTPWRVEELLEIESEQ